MRAVVYRESTWPRRVRAKGVGEVLVSDVDVFIDSAGAPNVVPDYLRGGKPGSRLVPLALTPRALEIPQTAFVLGELSLISSTSTPDAPGDRPL